MSVFDYYYREVLKVCNSDKRVTVLESLCLFLLVSRSFLQQSSTYITLFSLLVSALDDTYPSVQSIANKLSQFIIVTEKRTSFWPILSSSVISIFLESIQLAGHLCQSMCGGPVNSFIELSNKLNTLSSSLVSSSSSYFSSYQNSESKSIYTNITRSNRSSSDFAQDDESKLLFYLRTAIGCGILLTSSEFSSSHDTSTDVLLRRHGKEISQALLVMLTSHIYNGHKYVTYQTRQYYDSTNISEYEKIKERQCVEGSYYRCNSLYTRSEEIFQMVRRVGAVLGKLGMYICVYVYYYLFSL